MDTLIAALAGSGWVRCASIRRGLESAGLSVPSAQYLARAFSRRDWARAHRALEALRAHFAEARGFDAAAFGALLVPNPRKLDTRRALPASIRRDQAAGELVDFVDARLPAGKDIASPDRDWTLVATITGPAGLALGSCRDILRARATAFSVDGIDTRALMIRQIWGARVLQAGSELPDSTLRKAWTFTLFPGERLVAGEVPSGTILHGKVRMRLGRADRGISSARACPALLIA